MAIFYFCNATTTKNLPCQIPVKKEFDRCHFHKKGGIKLPPGEGGNPGNLLAGIYDLGKMTLDAICYIHATATAVPFVADLIKKGIDVFNSLADTSFDNPNDLRDHYSAKKSYLIGRLSTFDDREMSRFVNSCLDTLSLEESALSTESKKSQLEVC